MSFLGETRKISPICHLLNNLAQRVVKMVKVLSANPGGAV